jgi:hypothetical protein
MQEVDEVNGKEIPEKREGGGGGTKMDLGTGGIVLRWRRMKKKGC